MFIQIGFDIALNTTAPMALIHLLHLHPERRCDLMAPQEVEVLPALAVEEYTDAFGNRCSRVNVPVGVSQVGFRSQAIVRDAGLPDAVHWAAWQHDPTQLPSATLLYLCPAATAR